jgi:hypothetical protein
MSIPKKLADCGISRRDLMRLGAGGVGLFFSRLSHCRAT